MIGEPLGAQRSQCGADRLPTEQATLLQEKRQILGVFRSKEPACPSHFSLCATHKERGPVRLMRVDHGQQAIRHADRNFEALAIVHGGTSSIRATLGNVKKWHVVARLRNVLP